jgi:glucan biosynthesis protein
MAAQTVITGPSTDCSCHYTQRHGQKQATGRELKAFIKSYSSDFNTGHIKHYEKQSAIVSCVDAQNGEFSRSTIRETPSLTDHYRLLFSLAGIGVTAWEYSKPKFDTLGRLSKLTWQPLTMRQLFCPYGLV